MWTFRPSVIVSLAYCGLDGSRSSRHRFCRAPWEAYNIAGTALHSIAYLAGAKLIIYATRSVGVYVKEFGTVITTDSLLTPGFFDLSLCPTKSSMAGCVVLRATAFHDNVSVHRYVAPLSPLLSNTSTCCPYSYYLSNKTYKFCVSIAAETAFL